MSRRDKYLKYIHNFYGYGRWSASFWFVGVEEGGVTDLKDVDKRIESWLQFNSEVIDIKKHHIRIGQGHQFVGKAKLSRTWANLIRLRMGFDGKRNVDKEDVREIQKNDFGHSDSDNLLIELFPLPAKTSKQAHWMYQSISEIPFLSNRKTYEDALVESRVAFITNKVKTHRPKFVVFYALNKREYWNKIIGEQFKDKKNAVSVRGVDIYLVKKFDTTFVLTPHPNGIRKKNFDNNLFWQEVGKTLTGL